MVVAGTISNIIAASVATLVFGVLVGCGGSSSSDGLSNANEDSAVPTSMPSLPPTEPPTPPPTPTPGLGTTYTISDNSGNSATITLTKIEDPEAAQTGDEAAAGAHYVAGFFTITGVAGIFERDVFNDAGAVDNNGTALRAKIAAVGCSTDFSGSGEYKLTPNHSVSGCVPFEVLDGLHLSRVTWSGGVVWSVS